MNHLMSSVAKGVAVGAAVGKAAYMFKAKKQKCMMMKKSATKAMKTIGNVMENVAYMMK